MPPIESPDVVSLTKFFKVDEFIEVLEVLVPHVDTARSVEEKLSGTGAAIKELWNDLFTYEPRLERSSRAANQLLLDDELLRAARAKRPDAPLLVWCALMLSDSRLELVVREHLTDSDGRIIPAMVDRERLHACLVDLNMSTSENPKTTTNILSYLGSCQLMVLKRTGKSVTGVDRLLPTAHAVPGLIKLISERTHAWKTRFRPQDAHVVDFALSIGANHWLNLSQDEFRAASINKVQEVQIFPRPQLPGGLEELRSQLERKGQVVLQGPPGTGKTYLAKKYVSWATSGRRDEGHLQRILDSLPRHECTVAGVANEVERRGLTAVWEIVQIHPSYEYTDFVRALVAEPVAGGVTFTPKHRILSFLSALGLELAARNVDVELILVLDELNRGNIPAIFGELLYALEYRDEPVATPYSVDGSTSIAVPKSLQIIATMNTADRSIAVIDYALRRRFVFLDVPATAAPITSNTGYVTVRAKQIALRLFDMVGDLVSGATTGIQVGPSYFMPNSSATSEDEVILGLAESLVYEVLPLLSEYALEGEVDADEFNDFRNALSLGKGCNPAEVAANLIQLGATVQIDEVKSEEHAG